MKKYADRKRAEVDEYKVGDLVILSTKDLKYQMIERRTEKLTERFVGPYKINVTVALWTSSHILYGLPLLFPFLISVLRIGMYLSKIA